jgi:hypothetical protein
MSERVPIRGPGGGRAVSRSASSPTAFSIPFLAGQKGDMSRHRAHGKAVRGSKLPYRISVGGRALLSVYSLSQQDKDISLRSFPHQVPEDETLYRTSLRRWPMRLATSTTGRGSPRKEDAGDPCHAILRAYPSPAHAPPRTTRDTRSTPTPPTVIPPGL